MYKVEALRWSALVHNGSRGGRGGARVGPPSWAPPTHAENGREPPVLPESQDQESLDSGGDIDGTGLNPHGIIFLLPFLPFRPAHRHHVAFLSPLHTPLTTTSLALVKGQVKLELLYSRPWQSLVEYLSCTQTDRRGRCGICTISFHSSLFLPGASATILFLVPCQAFFPAEWLPQGCFSSWY